MKTIIAGVIAVVLLAFGFLVFKQYRNEKSDMAQIATMQNQVSTIDHIKQNKIDSLEIKIHADSVTISVLKSSQVRYVEAKKHNDTTLTKAPIIKVDSVFVSSYKSTDTNQYDNDKTLTPVYANSGSLVYRLRNNTCIDSSKWAEYMLLYVNKSLNDSIIQNEQAQFLTCDERGKNLTEALMLSIDMRDTSIKAFNTTSTKLMQCTLDKTTETKQKYMWTLIALIAGGLIGYESHK